MTMEPNLNDAVFGNATISPTTISTSIMNDTTAATMAPTADPTSILFGVDADFWVDKEAFWMIMWITGLVLFLCCPFCYTKSRRDLCWRRIKERRWIADDTEDDWYVAAMRRQQEQRRQRMEEEQREFQTSRTQEDEIREQFLRQCMKPYTMTLAAEDIHEMEESMRSSLKRSCSFGSLRSHGSRGSRNASKKEVLQSTDDMHDSDTVLESIDVESQTQMVITVDDNNNNNNNDHDNNTNEVKEERSDSLAEEEEEEKMLVFDFDDAHQKIYVPLPGQTLAENEAQEGAASSKRLVASGCAICLCLFDPDETITWASNPGCQHIFHSDCVLHWFLAVGRKTQKRRLRRNPDMTADEAIGKICEFPMACPCCRQDFCREVGKVEDSPSTATTRSTDELDSEDDEEVQATNETVAERDDIESGNAPEASSTSTTAEYPQS